MYKYPTLSIARYSAIQLSELQQCSVKKLAQGLKLQVGFEPRFPRLRVQCSSHGATALYDGTKETYLRNVANASLYSHPMCEWILEN